MENGNRILGIGDLLLGTGYWGLVIRTQRSQSLGKGRSVFWIIVDVRDMRNNLAKKQVVFKLCELCAISAPLCVPKKLTLQEQALITFKTLLP